MIHLVLLAMLSAGHDAISARLVKAPIIRGEFDQSKSMAGFKKPLKSKGTFVVSRSDGIVWNTSWPFQNELKVSSSEIVSTSSGRVVFELAAAKEPAVKAVNSLLFSLLSGDLTQLEASFDLTSTVLDADHWRVRLQPKLPALKQLFSAIDIEGDSFVRSVEIAEATGDKTVMQLRNISTDRSP